MSRIKNNTQSTVEACIPNRVHIEITQYHNIDRAFVDLVISRRPHFGRHRARTHVSLMHCSLAQTEFTAQTHAHT